MALTSPQSLKALRGKGTGRAGPFRHPWVESKIARSSVTRVSFNRTGERGAGSKLQPAQDPWCPHLQEPRVPEGEDPAGNEQEPRASLAPSATPEPWTEPRGTAQRRRRLGEDAGLGAPGCGTQAAPGWRRRRPPQQPRVSGRLLLSTSQDPPLDVPSPVRRAPDPPGQPQQRSEFIGFTYCHGGPGMDCFSKKWVGRDW